MIFWHFWIFTSNNLIYPSVTQVIFSQKWPKWTFFSTPFLKLVSRNKLSMLKSQGFALDLKCIGCIRQLSFNLSKTLFCVFSAGNFLIFCSSKLVWVHYKRVLGESEFRVKLNSKFGKFYAIRPVEPLQKPIIFDKLPYENRHMEKARKKTYPSLNETPHSFCFDYAAKMVICEENSTRFFELRQGLHCAKPKQVFLYPNVWLFDLQWFCWV